MDNSKKRITVNLEYEPSPDSEQRLLQAIDMLLKGIAINPAMAEDSKRKNAAARKEGERHEVA